MNKLLRIITMAICTIASLTLPLQAENTQQSVLPPSELLVDLMTAPLAVDSVNPRFSWKCNDPDRGEKQTAYQIIVGSTLAKMTSTVGDIWDTGKIESSRSTGIKYVGASLSSDTRYWWKVRTWDKDGNAGSYSRAATFDVGLLEADWTAQFIWDGTENPNNVAFFRKQFTIDESKTIEIAKLYISAHDDYKLWVNHTKAGVGPVRSNPFKSMMYNSYDLTSALKAGADNVIAVTGHNHQLFGTAGKNGPGAIICELRIKYSDGSRQTIKTDETWKINASTPWREEPYVIFSRKFFGGSCSEYYDARKEITDWTTVAFDDSSWANAVVVKPDYQLKAQYCALDKVEKIIDPVSVYKDGADWYVEFEACYNGWPRLTMTENMSGSKISIHYYETKDRKDHEGRRKPRRANYDVYVCKGGTEIWEPNINHESFRTLKIQGYEGVLDASKIKCIFSHTEVDQVGDFTCSNPLINDIYKMCERSTRQNMQQGMFSVDAWREQSGYTADSYILGMNSLYSYKNCLQFRKIIRDHADEPYKNSKNLTSRAPTSRAQDIPEWTLHWVFCLWEQYLFYDDTALLETMYPTLQGVMSYFDAYRSASTHLLTDTPGWAISDYPASSVDHESGNVFTAQNCQYYRALRDTAKIAALLGHAADAESYHATASKVKDGINTHLFDGVEKYKDCSGSSKYHPVISGYALIFDVVPTDKTEAVVNYIRKEGFSTVGTSGGAWFVDALHKYNSGLSVYEILNTEDQYWGQMVTDDTKSKACWEKWGGPTYNHSWSAYPAAFLLNGTVGLKPTSAGYSTFDIRPAIDGGLTSADATVPTIKGNIRAGWVKDGVKNTFLQEADVPVNTTARICIPKSGLKNIQIKEGGTVIWDNGTYKGGVSGITYDGEEPEFVRFNVGSGSYSFERSYASNQDSGTSGAP
jgi:alpha-L-rhamnosidase